MRQEKGDERRGETKKKRREREERLKYRKSSALQTRCCLVLTPFHDSRPWPALDEGVCGKKAGPRVMGMELGPSRCMSRELDIFCTLCTIFFFFFFLTKAFYNPFLRIACSSPLQGIATSPGFWQMAATPPGGCQ